MKECLFYTQKDGVVQCKLCPRLCVINDGSVGDCKVRKNVSGKLISLSYGNIGGGLAVDPIEKKPLYHFYPGSKVLSFGTAGCNLHCSFCQNHTTSQVTSEDIDSMEMTPLEIVELAIDENIDIIAYTYNEPVVFFEYMLETARLARESGIKNVMVSNGFINEGPLRELCRYIDAANIDLKSFDDGFYRIYTSAWLAPVLESIKILKDEDVWVEMTNLLIPGKNDDMRMIEEMSSWIADNVGVDVPLHFSAFFPCYLMMDVMPTPKDTLLLAKKVAMRSGIKYVYLGNVLAQGESDTFCPSCGKLMIVRGRLSLIDNRLIDGKCECGNRIDGVWR